MQCKASQSPTDAAAAFITELCLLEHMSQLPTKWMAEYLVTRVHRRQCWDCFNPYHGCIPMQLFHILWTAPCSRRTILRVRNIRDKCNFAGCSLSRVPLAPPSPVCSSSSEDMQLSPAICIDRIISQWLYSIHAASEGWYLSSRFAFSRNACQPQGCADRAAVQPSS